MPALPDDVLIQLFWADTGAIYRITLDGHYRVTLPGQEEKQERPMSYYERGREALSNTALERIQAAITATAFDQLGPEIPATATAGQRLTGSGAIVASRPLIVTVRDGTKIHSTLVHGDAAAPESLGPLAELYRILDRDALGGWMYE